MCLTATAVVIFASSAASLADVTVYSNGAYPGDTFTNAGGSNTGQAVGTSGWYYNNVRNWGEVGINTNYARSGNGSAYVSTVYGPGGASSKSDIEFLASAIANVNGNYGPGAALGLFAQLNSLSYDWYRDSSSINNNVQHPVIRVGVISPDTKVGGYLVFERVYQSDPSLLNQPVPTDQWVTDDVFGNNYRLWSTGNLPNNISGSDGPVQQYDARTLSEWQSLLSTYYVTTISLGVGSGWGPFEGAVDNVTFAFGTALPTTYNFEVPAVVPEAGSLVVWSLFGLTLGGVGLWRRKCSAR
jgi:hypothetical protein